MTSTGNNSVGGSLTSTGQWRSDGYRTPLTAKIERTVGRRAIDVTCLVAPGRDQPAPSVRGHGHVGQCWVIPGALPDYRVSDKVTYPPPSLSPLTSRSRVGSGCPHHSHGKKLKKKKKNRISAITLAIRCSILRKFPIGFFFFGNFQTNIDYK